MDEQDTLYTSPQKRGPWNKGKFTGAKPPLRPKHVWSIRSKSCKPKDEQATLRCSI
jgi:hypothetical protein